MKISRRQLMAFALAAPLGLSACQATYRNHGYIPPEEQLAQVVVGQTPQAELEGLIGRPSAQGLLTGSAWYYVGSRWQFYGPREPREIDRQVVAISFAESGVVSNVERFGLERGQVVVLSRRVTDTGVTSLGLIRQLLGNVGRVQAGDFLGD
ncbi:outer membrane protein assembly factor BamE (plasmid) [Paracoccus versutus]|jgi:outer membrane protein assembly factor BamE (lipoprotein component of BamABCDE complex)|uniref:Beta-barrel assembly machine subunit BamE n=2 Tax=Paracoccaceae TaxID=31989 RepID=A0A099FP48_PARVE|nr:SmpA/OmlA [Paracoccus versutus]MBT0780977.1 outer membrane protein assembly factor BamE [Paracoccus sp. pheM1]RDD71268.1 outer membrane protein assembly factor BamE [Paracoccus versutus]REF72804.1 Beta-barrel assembly machine subunit BamE [Paracoccus versutus]REG55754.1 Beta-barrel assembly machine subunit BamE [Paracoccus versutus]